MDAWGVLGAYLMLFPPVTIVGVALLAQLIALLNDKRMSWGKAFLIGFGVFVLTLAGAVVFG